MQLVVIGLGNGDCASSTLGTMMCCPFLWYSTLYVWPVDVVDPRRVPSTGMNGISHIGKSSVIKTAIFFFLVFAIRQCAAWALALVVRKLYQILVFFIQLRAAWSMNCNVHHSQTSTEIRGIKAKNGTRFTPTIETTSRLPPPLLIVRFKWQQTAAALGCMPVFVVACLEHIHTD